MTKRISVSQYLNDNPLDQNQMENFLIHAASNESFVYDIRRSIIVDSWPEGVGRDNELEKLNSSIVSFLVEYLRKRKLKSSAVFFLRAAAEDRFGKE